MFSSKLLNQEQDENFGKTYYFWLSLIGRREVAKIVPPFPDDQPNDILLAVVKPDQKELPTAPIHFSPASATNGEIIPTEYCIGDEVEEVKPNDEPLPVILVNTEPIIDAIKEVGSCIERLEGYTKPAETTSEETSRWVEKRKRGMSATQIANEENKPGVKASKIQQRIGRYFKEHLDEKPEPLRTKKEQSAQ